MRIAVGTAQFGFDYGVTNRTGRLPDSNCRAILAMAREYGLETLDTAIAYGDAESRLGAFGVDDFRIISKLPAVPPDCADCATWVLGELEGSLRRLRVEQLDTLLLHRPSQLLERNGPAIVEALLESKRRGLVARIGVSVYAPAELEELVPIVPLDVVQGPLNVLDRRFVQSGWLSRLAREGIAFHARSLFLQGLLLASERVPALSAHDLLLDEWARWTSDHGTGRVEAAVRFVSAHPEVEVAVVGVESAEQLGEVIRASRHGPIDVPKRISSEDERLLNPSLWRLL